MGAEPVSAAACRQCLGIEMHVFSEGCAFTVRCASCKTPWVVLPEWMVLAGQRADAEDIRAAMERSALASMRKGEVSGAGRLRDHP